ncbi:hypothetical protein OIU78_000213 [Salix suchowensis]|nr:hypothetical protein OIU78_000213 [Salix suchowensis]
MCLPPPLVWPWHALDLPLELSNKCPVSLKLAVGPCWVWLLLVWLLVLLFRLFLPMLSLSNLALLPFLPVDSLGTLNSDEARDFDLPLKKRFFLQPLPPSEAAVRAKESAQDILGVKTLIDQKAWPYVQNDLRLKAGYLRFDLNTVISAKSKDEKKSLKELTGKLFDTIDNLDHAAKIKSTPEAEKYYAQTVSTLNDVLAKLG